MKIVLSTKNNIITLQNKKPYWVRFSAKRVFKKIQTIEPPKEIDTDCSWRPTNSNLPSGCIIGGKWAAVDDMSFKELIKQHNLKFNEVLDSICLDN